MMPSMFYALILLLLFGTTAMAKDTPIVPQSRLSTVAPNAGDEYDQVMERLDAGDESAWDDLQKLSENAKTRRAILKNAPKVETKNAR